MLTYKNNNTGNNHSNNSSYGNINVYKQTNKIADETLEVMLYNINVARISCGMTKLDERRIQKVIKRFGKIGKINTVGDLVGTTKDQMKEWIGPNFSGYIEAIVHYVSTKGLY